MRQPQPMVQTLCRAYDWQKVATLAFWTVAGLFLVAALGLAAVNQSAGSEDSKNNLDTARNLAAGRGFTSNIVQQFCVRQSLPNPETIRTPGIPFLMAGLILLFGFSLALPVLLNVVTVLATAWLFRRTIQIAGGGWFASMAGILVLISGHYQLISLWNNNMLVLCTVGLLWVAAKQKHQGWPAWKVVVASAAVTTFGFLMKPTFILSAVPFVVFLLFTSNCQGLRAWRQAAGRAAAFLALVVALSSPYWGRNLVLFGHPLYSLSTTVRLGVRYGGLPYGEFPTVRVARPVTYGERLRLHGLGGLLSTDLRMVGQTAWRILLQNPAICLLIVIAPIVFPTRRTRQEYVLTILAMAEPIFATAVYWHVEARYLWPIYPCMLYLVALGIRDYRLRPMPRPAGVPRLAIASGVLLLAVGYGVFHGQRVWGRFVQETGNTPPTWIPQVTATAPDAVILTDDPFSVAWYADRRAVRLPGGPREDLLRVIEYYRPTHCLITDVDAKHRAPTAFEEADLRLLACSAKSGGQSAWRFYETEISTAVAATSEPRPR